MLPNYQAIDAASSCQGKEELTNTMARQIAEAMRKRGRHGISAYHCNHCGFWHVGRGSGRIEDARRIGKNQRGEQG